MRSEHSTKSVVGSRGKSFPLFPGWKTTLLHYSSQFPHCVLLDSAGSEADRYGKYEVLVGLGDKDPVRYTHWEALKKAESRPAWRMGILTYDLKNRFEPVLQTRHYPTFPFPELYFFEPEIVIGVEKGKDTFWIEAKNPEEIAHRLLHNSRQQITPITPPQNGYRKNRSGGLTPNLSRSAYLKTIEAIRENIREGEVYEMNFCQEFSAHQHIEHPEKLYERLVHTSPMPFSTFTRIKDTYLLCASPERFLSHQQGQLLTQPIKGTAPRGITPEADQVQKDQLRTSLKERAENVMIVDLARNDLYRSCKTNSVEVPHLFEVQTFPQLHQLVSTVIGERNPETSPLEALKNAFPPGSMTGAPKIRACQLIDELERSRRGIYSGSVGYMDPEGNFDFNVVIRSLVYNSAKELLSYHVGGAITYDSQPGAEYNETLLKAKAIEEILGANAKKER